MIKISVDNLSRVSRLVPLIIAGANCWLILTCIWMGSPSIDVLYGIVLLLQLFKVRIWRFFLLSDVYVDGRRNEVVFQKLNGEREIFSRKEVVSYTTNSGITEVVLSSGSAIVRKYFIANAADGVLALADGFQGVTGLANQPGTGSQPGADGEDSQFRFNEVRTRRALKKYNFWFFVPPLIVIPLMLIVAHFWAQKDDREIAAMQFNGRVDSVWYDANKKDAVYSTPHVAIQGKVFYLFNHSWDFRQDIMPGDSLVKQSNSLVVTLIKRNGKKIVFKGD